MTRLNGLAVLALMALTITACESKNSLSRSKAKRAIETSAGFTAHTGQIQLTDDEVQAGIAQGYWNINVPDTYVALTPKGQQAFTSAKSDPFAGGIFLQTHEEVKPVVLEVTGIQDTSPTQKMVEFKWKLEIGRAHV